MSWKPACAATSPTGRLVSASRRCAVLQPQVEQVAARRGARGGKPAAAQRGGRHAREARELGEVMRRGGAGGGSGPSSGAMAGSVSPAGGAAPGSSVSRIRRSQTRVDAVGRRLGPGIAAERAQLRGLGQHTVEIMDGPDGPRLVDEAAPPEPRQAVRVVDKEDLVPRFVRHVRAVVEPFARPLRDDARRPARSRRGPCGGNRRGRRG